MPSVTIYGQPITIYGQSVSIYGADAPVGSLFLPSNFLQSPIGGEGSHMLPGQTLRGTISLSGAATGTPTAKFLHNGVNDVAVTPIVAAGADANEWLVSAIIPSSGYVAGDTIEISVTATIFSADIQTSVTQSYAFRLSVIASDVFARLGAPSGASISADIQTRSTYAGGPVASVTAPVTVGTNNDKTGYSLASSGLNAIAGVNGWSFPQMLRALVAFVTLKRTGVPASGAAGTVTFTNASTADFGTVTFDTTGDITANNMTPTA